MARSNKDAWAWFVVAGVVACSSPGGPSGPKDGITGCVPPTGPGSAETGGTGGAGGEDEPIVEELPCYEQPDQRTYANRFSLVGNPCAMEKLPEDQRWVLEPDTWKFPPGTDGLQDGSCYIYSHRHPLTFPTLEWTECGQGCEKAELWTGLGEELVGQGAVFMTGDGHPFLSKRHYFETFGGRRAQLQVIMDLETGEGIGLLLDVDTKERYPSCEIALGSFVRRGAIIKKKMGPSTHQLAVSWSIHGWRWALPALDASEERLPDCQAEWLRGSRMLFLCPQQISGMIKLGSSKLTVLERMPYHRISESAADDELAVWVEGTLYWGEEDSQWWTRVRGWSPDEEGLRVILDHFPGHSELVAMGGGSIAGFQGENPTEAVSNQFWIAPRDVEDPGLPPRFGPEIFRGVLHATELATWDEWIAADPMIVEEDEPDGTPGRRLHRVVLTRASDWKTRWIGEAEGFESVFGIALNSSHLYVVPAKLSDSWGRTPVLYRYDLSQFESLGKETP